MSLMSGPASEEVPVQRRAALWKRPKARKGAPESLRQVVQWQRVMEMGRVLLLYMTRPHEQLPRSTAGGGGMGGSVVMSMSGDGPVENFPINKPSNSLNSCQVSLYIGAGNGNIVCVRLGRESSHKVIKRAGLRAFRRNIAYM